MAQTRSIFMIENYSDRGPRQRRATIEIYQLSQDYALGLFTSRTRITLGLDHQKGNQRYHSKNRSLNEHSIKIQSLR